MSKWISIKDGLPEISTEDIYGYKRSEAVLCLHADGHHEDCYLYESENIDEVTGELDHPFWVYVADSDVCETVTHWMPLPEPPKPKQR